MHITMQCNNAMGFMLQKSKNELRCFEFDDIDSSVALQELKNDEIIKKRAIKSQTFRLTGRESQQEDPGCFFYFLEAEFLSRAMKG